MVDGDTSFIWSVRVMNVCLDPRSPWIASEIDESGDIMRHIGNFTKYLVMRVYAGRDCMQKA